MIKWTNVILTAVIAGVLIICIVGAVTSDRFESKNSIPEVTPQEVTEVQDTKPQNGKIINYGTVIENNQGTVNLYNYQNGTKKVPNQKVEVVNQEKSVVSDVFSTWAAMICVLAIAGGILAYLIINKKK